MWTSLLRWSKRVPSVVRKPKGRRPYLEELESRLTPAFNFTFAFDPMTATLTITGTADSNSAVLARDEAGNIYLNDTDGMNLHLDTGADVTTTDTINVVFPPNSGANVFDTFILNQSSGAFGPGTSDRILEASGSLGEIEIHFSASENFTLFIDGQRGDDRIDAGTAGINLNGDDDADVLFDNLSPSALTLSGGEGNDTISAAGSAAVGGPSTLNLSLSGGPGDDVLVGGDGFDELTPGTGIDSLDGGPSSDRILGSGSVLRLTATTLSDGLGNVATFTNIERGLLSGDNGDNKINAAKFRGLLTIAGYGGKDIIVGSHFDDLNSNTGDEFIFGGPGNDTIRSGRGDDEVSGEEGNDSIFGGQGFDALRGNGDNDILQGGAGNDSLFGAAGDDILGGGAGQDQGDGGAGSDTCVGVEQAVNCENSTGGGGRGALTSERRNTDAPATAAAPRRAEQAVVAVRRRGLRTASLRETTLPRESD